jgi:adenosine deaminase
VSVPAAAPATLAEIRALPKVALHDHLDGGLRPRTVLDLGRELGVDAPGRTPAQVADWFARSADSGSLERYLQTFDRTVALMQTPGALRRIAREFVEDMAADRVVYAETRWAPAQHTAGGLSVGAAVDAVQEGLEEGMEASRAAGRPVVVRQLLSYLRQHEPTDELVEAAVARRDRGVVGLDLAGPESGFPATRFARPFRLAREHGLHVTIHAGEAEGPASVQEALDCGAERIGHGVRLVEDLGPAGPGPVATRVRDLGVPLEVCPRSNLQTGASDSIATHPVAALRRAGMRVTISCDNRLMSRTTLTDELHLLVRTFGWTLEDLRGLTLAALDAAFCDEGTREALRRALVHGPAD